MQHRLGTLLMVAGAGLATLGVLGLAFGMWIHLRPRAVIAIAKATPFVVGALVLVLGAVLRRRAGTGGGALRERVPGGAPVLPHENAPQR